MRMLPLIAVLAALPVAAQTPQQTMMKCNASAGVLTGDERKDFMKQCLRLESGKNVTAARKQAAKPGAALGMTPEEVIRDTAWGKPQKVNRTVTRAGVHEQWVYGGHNYLYFDNGRLTGIQN